ncbi:MAG TPA: methyltransferase domain-containing protein [Candidatus Angelobacter sp.]
MIIGSRPRVNQCKKPTGWLGRFILRNMNSRHSGVTDWGLSHISIEKRWNILDVGCGGGRTVGKLAALASQGKVYGIDYSSESVAVAGKTNRQWIDAGMVEIVEGSVSQLPFPEKTFDLVTAVETHFWWPDLPNDMREILRVLKPGGVLLIIGEVYKGAETKTAALTEKYLPLSGMKLLTIDEHRVLYENAGYTEIKITVEPRKGWITGIGRKPIDQAYAWSATNVLILRLASFENCTNPPSCHAIFSAVLVP